MGHKMQNHGFVSGFPQKSLKHESSFANSLNGKDHVTSKVETLLNNL